MTNRQHSAMVPSGAQLPQRERVSFTITRRARSDAQCRLDHHAFGEAPPRFGAQEVGDTTAQELRCAGHVHRAISQPGTTARTRHMPDRVGAAAVQEIVSPSAKRIAVGNCASRSLTQPACVINNAVPARFAARGGRVTTTIPSVGSMRRLIRRARALRRQRTRARPARQGQCFVFRQVHGHREGMMHAIRCN